MTAIDSNNQKGGDQFRKNASGKVLVFYDITVFKGSFDYKNESPQRTEVDFLDQTANSNAPDYDQSCKGVWSKKPTAWVLEEERKNSLYEDRVGEHSAKDDNLQKFKTSSLSNFLGIVATHEIVI